MAQLAHGTPRGVGIFARTLPRSGAAQFAARARDHRLSFVPLFAIWQDEAGDRLPTERTTMQYADALRKVGVDVWLWGYPHAGREDAFVDALVARARRAGARGVILDPEVSYKGRPRAMERLVALTVDALDESLSVGFTSFGQPSLHRTFPWAQAGAIGWGGPQLYSLSPARAVRALDQWEAHGWSSLLPALPTFGPRSKPSELNALVSAMQRHRAVHGLLFWSWNTADARDLRLIAQAAEAFESSERTASNAVAAAPHPLPT